MNYPRPRVLKIRESNAMRRGEIHGETLREHVHAMAKVRVDLMQSEAGFASEQDVLDLARLHLPVLKQYDAELHEELIGIARGSDLSPEHIVVLNHFTDMRDLKPGLAYDTDGGCSAVYLPTHVLGQTWDIHASAMKHVVILDLGDVMIFSVAGCLGMTGMNQHGVGVTVNNLTSTDARVGVVWPAVVRHALKYESAKQAIHAIEHTHLGSGHHYLVADTHDAFGIETSGTQKKITQTGGDRLHFHTNHCLDEELARTHQIRSTSTTHKRYDELERIFKNHMPATANELYEALGRVSIAPDSNNLGVTATCGAFVMDLTRKQVLTCVGPASEGTFHNPPLHLDMQP